MSLGASIRKRRKSLDITLQGLANQIQADAGNLSRIERGELGISDNLLRKIAEALSCTPAYLYTQSDNSFGVQENIQPYLVNSTLSKSPANKRPHVLAKDFVHWFRSATP